MARVLVLDDEKSRQQAFQQKLIGHVYIGVYTAREAIRELESNGPFDYVFLDHDLGGKIFVPSGPGTGYEVAEWLEAHPDKQPANIVIHSFNELEVSGCGRLFLRRSIVREFGPKIFYFKSISLSSSKGHLLLFS